MLQFFVHPTPHFDDFSVLLSPEKFWFQKIEKQRADEEAGEQADLIQHELENLPIVQDYRQKMQDASDLIQYVTKSIEERINEELRHG